MKILLARRGDLEFLLGSAALKNKHHSDSCFSEIVVSDVYPASIEYNLRSEWLKIGFDYLVREEKVDEKNLKYMGYHKAANEAFRRRKKELDCERRSKKRSLEFIGFSLFESC